MTTLTANPVKNYVYIIETGRKNGNVNVRIGKSTDVEQRRKGIKIYCPNAKILHTFHVANDNQTALKIERKIHKMFSIQNVEGDNFEFNSIFLANVVVPQITQFVKSLNVEEIPAPSEKVATRQMSKQEYMALKVQLAKLNNKMSKEGELEFFERALRQNIIDRLAEEANREKALSLLKFTMKQAKRKAYLERKAKEQRAFHYLAFIMR
mgnify:FL=1|tara:strand:- start:453 stop:1079 length:627 start_codon:yes stop_codon:yes gene_type:complete